MLEPRPCPGAVTRCLLLFHKADVPLCISQCGIAYHEPYLRLIEKLLPVMPNPSLDSFFFWNSGSEAVEGALKMARIYTGRKGIITMQGLPSNSNCSQNCELTGRTGAYHGRTFGSMAVTRSKTIYSEGSGPLMVCQALAGG